MRKFLHLLLLLSVISCGKLSSESSAVFGPLKLTADEITALRAMDALNTLSYDTAEQLAVETPGLFNGDTKSAVKRIAEGMAITKDMADLTKSDVYASDALMYLFNYADNGGYIFVSADERAQGILAYIENGNFNPAEAIECPGTAMLFSGIETMQRLEIEKVERIKDSIGETTLQKYNKWLETDSTVPLTKAPTIINVRWETEYGRNSSMGYGRLVKTNWYQGNPFNAYLPLLPNGNHAVVGCVAIVATQLMAHYNYPQYYDDVPLYTSQLRTLINSGDFNTPDLVHKIAYFNKVAFNNIISSYDNNGSGAYYKDMANFLHSVGYIIQKNTSDYNFENIKSSINSRWPVYTEGCSHRTNRFLGWIYSYHGGHAWIIDAYSNITIYDVKVTTYSDSTVKREKTLREVKMYNHCNMGWGWGSNGYYPEGVFDTNKGPDTKSNDVDGVYKYEIKIATGIRPI